MSQKCEQIEFPRGSEWRRWNLQVHTPLSALNNSFGQDFDAYASSAVAEPIALIRVTDYFTIDGYKQLRSLWPDPLSSVRRQVDRKTGADQMV